MKEGRREAAMFLIIYLTSRAAVWIRWPCLLLVFIRRSEITLFFSPVTSYSILVYFCMGWGCSPQSMQIKSFDLCTFPAADWTLNLILLLCSRVCPELRLDTVNWAYRSCAGIHYFLHNMRKQHLNETFVSCQNGVASTLSIQIRGSGEEGEKALILDCNKAVSHVMVAH